MVYIFDTNSFGMLCNFFPGRFPSFWENFNEMVLNNQILSVREVRHELENRTSKKCLHLFDWIKRHGNIFLIPSPEETRFVSEIFRVQHFRDLVNLTMVSYHQERCHCEELATKQSLSDEAISFWRPCKNLEIASLSLRFAQG